MYKTVQCKYCKKQVAPDAAACPNCGSQNPKKTGSDHMYELFIGIVLFFVFLAIMGAIDG